MNSKNKNNTKIDLSKELESSDKNTSFQNKNMKPNQYQSFLPGTPKMVQWLIKYSNGLIKNEKQANFVLIIFIALAIIISLFLVFDLGNIMTSQETKIINPEEAGSSKDFTP